MIRVTVGVIVRPNKLLIIFFAHMTNIQCKTSLRHVWLFTSYLYVITIT